MQAINVGGELCPASVMKLGNASNEVQEKYYAICDQATAVFAQKGVKVNHASVYQQPLSLLQQHCALQDRGLIILLNVKACYPKPEEGVKLDDTSATFLGAFLKAEAGSENTNPWNGIIYNRTNNEQWASFERLTKETYLPKMNAFLGMEPTKATEYVEALCKRLQTEIDALQSN
ncbi:hypothetical protein [Endozoicomonas ascidiicola]|uniref:hypothetical protein n=1 Tax=Endozoicomonas ascidiicola TaxID=1698521 RepID=UPI0012FD7FD9|nr:hypothetical protein [Endozoicomonas ascidiicola]